VGVGITVAIKTPPANVNGVFFKRIDKNLRREKKLSELARLEMFSSVDWEQLSPDENSTWLVPEHDVEFHSYISVGSKEHKQLDSKDREKFFFIRPGSCHMSRCIHVRLEQEYFGTESR
jgi:predicted helicase